MKANIYAVPIDANNEHIEGLRMPWFYLHGIAQDKNGYDICNGDLQAFYYALSNGLFIANLHFIDDTTLPCLVYVYHEQDRQQGFVVLIDDYPAIEYALTYNGPLNDIPDMYMHIADELKAYHSETYSIIKSLILKP